MTGPELAARARALIPMLAENAVEAEKQRKPVDAVITALEEAEIYKLMVPQCYGGLELDMDTFFEVGVALDEGDASTAWVSNFYIQSACEASGAHSHFLDSPFQRVWRDVNTMSCHVVFDLDSKLQTYGRTLLA